MKKQGLKDMKCSIGVAYLLEEETTFYDIGYRVLMNQEKDNLLKCIRLRYNGQWKLVYAPAVEMPVLELVEEWTSEQRSVVWRNIVKAIRDVDENGFLNVACIDSRLSHIFVHPDTYEVKLVYLPIKMDTMFDAKRQLVEQIRQNFMAVTGLEPTSEKPSTKKAQPVITAPKAVNPQPVPKMQPMQQEGMVCSLESTRGLPAILITKDLYVIGKNPEAVDGLIEGNPAVSRVHCQIVKNQGSYYVMDLGSANGTFLNGQRLAQNTYHELHGGDELVIANETFYVRR